MDFVPVDLISRDGRPFTARSAVQLTNLQARGYRAAETPVEQSRPEVVLVPPTIPSTPPETPPATAS